MNLLDLSRPRLLVAKILGIASLALGERRVDEDLGKGNVALLGPLGRHRAVRAEGRDEGGDDDDAGVCKMDRKLRGPPEVFAAVVRGEPQVPAQARPQDVAVQDRRENAGAQEALLKGLKASVDFPARPDRPVIIQTMQPRWPRMADRLTKPAAAPDVGRPPRRRSR